MYQDRVKVSKSTNANNLPRFKWVIWLRTLNFSSSRCWQSVVVHGARPFCRICGRFKRLHLATIKPLQYMNTDFPWTKVGNQTNGFFTGCGNRIEVEPYSCSRNRLTQNCWRSKTVKRLLLLSSTGELVNTGFLRPRFAIKVEFREVSFHKTSKTFGILKAFMMPVRPHANG